MFKYYVPDLDLLTINYIVYENTFAGGFITTPIRSFVTRPNIQEKPRERALIICDSLALVCAGILVAVCIFHMYCTLSEPKTKKRFYIMRVFKFPYVLIYLAFAGTLVAVISMACLKNDTVEIISTPGLSKNFMNMYNWYQALTYAQYLAFASSMLFILRWVRMFHSFRDVLYIVRKVRTGNK